jgi:hypothetical protein
VLLAISWLTNALLLIAGIVFVYGFGQSRDVIGRVQHALMSGDWRSSGSPNAGNYLLCVVAIVAAIVVSFTLFASFVSLFTGGLRFRSTRMWLVFMALAAGWLALVGGWPEIYWNGQQRRVRPVLAAAELMVSELNADWPTEDGYRPGIGPFQAYPMYSKLETPTMLMTLDEARFSGTRIQFSAVERMRNKNVMRFQLAGDEAGGWLEWRGDDSGPESFVGGLDTAYSLERVQRLAPHWYLVRYGTLSLLWK